MTTTESRPATDRRDPRRAWPRGSRPRCARSSAATCRCGCARGTAPRPARRTRRWSSCARATPYAGCCGIRASSEPRRPTSPARSRSTTTSTRRSPTSGRWPPSAGCRACGPRPARSPARCVRRSASARSARRPPLPASQARVRGRLHSKLRDRRAISHHYDLSNEFYSLLLDPSMAYSSGYWRSDDPSYTVERRAARQARPGLPQGRPRARACASSTSAAAGARCRCTRPSTSAPGSPASRSPPSRSGSSTQRIRERGLEDRVEIRLQDYREIPEVAGEPAVRRRRLDRDGRARRRAELRHLRAGPARRREARRPGAGPADVALRWTQRPSRRRTVHRVLHRAGHAHAAGRRDRRVPRARGARGS